MNRKGPRPQVFVCACISNSGTLITKIIQAASKNEAASFFKDKFNQNPQEIMGPFFKKRERVVEQTRKLTFSNQSKKAIFNDWFVNAFILIEPVDHAFLVFIKRVDDKPMPKPQGTIAVPISDLRFI